MVSVNARIGVLLGLATGLGVVSCARWEPPLGARDPARKIPAMKEAVAQKDRRAIPQLIENLNSDDPAVRLYAIVALEKLTGQTFDYQFYAERPVRQQAIERWHRWLTGQQPAGAATAPTSQPG